MNKPSKEGPPNVAIIGAGLSGICAGIKLKKDLEISSFQIFDERPDFGGTWLVNNYPGAATQIPGFAFSFSCSPNPNWTKSLPSQAEFLQYIRDATQKYGLVNNTSFNTHVESLEWLEKDGKWRMKAHPKNSPAAVQELFFDFVVIATGYTRLPLIPPEFHNFKGVVMHSAEWNHSVDLRGKVVGVVGNGASAVQVIPAIAPLVKDLHLYQRKPLWVSPAVQFDVPKILRKMFAIFPFLLLLVRFLIFNLFDLYGFAFSKRESKIQTWMGNLAHWHMKRASSKWRKGLTFQDLKPDHKFCTENATLSNDYLQVFQRSNVHLHRGKIQRVEAGGIFFDEKSEVQKLDILILATGFDALNFFAPMKILGVDGIDLGQKWKRESPSTLCGIMTHDLPNAFFILGPSTICANSGIFSMERQSDLMVRVIRETVRTGGKSVRPRKSAVEEWTRSLKRRYEKSVFTREGTWAYMIDSQGLPLQLWPNACSVYGREVAKVNFSQMEWTF